MVSPTSRLTDGAGNANRPDARNKRQACCKNRVYATTNNDVQDLNLYYPIIESNRLDVVTSLPHSTALVQSDRIGRSWSSRIYHLREYDSSLPESQEESYAIPLRLQQLHSLQSM